MKTILKSSLKKRPIITIAHTPFRKQKPVDLSRSATLLEDKRNWQKLFSQETTQILRFLRGSSIYPVFSSSLNKNTHATRKRLTSTRGLSIPI